MNVTNPQKVALRDVARRAGVSLGTASNVFSNKPGVTSKTRDAVLAAAAELGYQPRASTVLQAAVTTLGFVVRSTPDPVLSNPFYSQVLHGTEQACNEFNISLLYAVLDENIASLEQLPPMVQRKQIQGLLVVGYFNPSFFSLLQRQNIPFITIDYYLDTLDTDSVLNDDERGGYLATKHLLERVANPVPAIILGDLSHSSIHNRLLGYRRALAEHGLPYNEAYVAHGYHSTDEGYRNTLALLDLDTPPNALFCCNDITALGALSALRERGITVPDACSVVGFDDLDLVAHTVPPLTTIRVDKALLGAQGVRLLLERIAHPELTARRMIISAKLVERGSVQNFLSCQ